MNIKQKVRIKMQQMNIDILSDQTSVGVNRLFLLVYSNQDGNAKRFKTRKYFLSKGITKIIALSSIEKFFITKQLIVI